MAILRSDDGQFYNVPDAQLEAMLVPAEQVKGKLASAAEGSTDENADAVTPHGYCRPRWRNCWNRNCWRNFWRNCWH